jgi:hypothetical protein
MVARELIGAFVVGAVALVWCPLAAQAVDCSAGSSTANNSVFAEATCEEHGEEHSTEAISTGSDSSPYYTDYRLEIVCFIRSETGSQSAGCPPSAPDTCQPGQVLYQQFGLHQGQWETVGQQFCRDNEPGAGALVPPVTPDLVAHAFQQIPLPSLRSVTQPAEKTLINFDTIFYVDARPLHRTLNLLGQRVELEITPSTFRWVHGDGTTTETQTAGAPYPAKDVVYRYQVAHVTVKQHVEIVWTARWSLNGGAYQDVDGTVTTVGPDTPLRIAEATPALSGYGH